MKATLVLLKTNKKAQEQAFRIYSLLKKLKISGFIIEIWYASDSDEQIFELYGDHVIHIKKQPNTSVEQWISTLSLLYEKQKPNLIVFPDDIESKEIYPRLAYRIGGEAFSSCQQIDWIEEKSEFLLLRPLYSGNLLGRFTISKSPLLVGVSENVFQNYVPENKYSGTFENIFIEQAKTGDAEVINRISCDTGSLSNVDIIFTVGNGLGNVKEYESICSIAKKIGAEIGATRPMVQNGTIPVSRLIGTTGNSVSPELLITFGVSGSGPFMEGVHNAKRLIAINNNESALIFRNADIIIAADCKKVIRELEILL